ncbi:MAG: hypothetical protein EPN66_06775 [Rhodanobacter sp.]|nr:MAG: hypothetical protein EPN66_06775 [Rhodanobacter sp.]
MALGLSVLPLAVVAQQVPPAAAQFQQTMQQQHVSDQLQKSQQQAQQQQNVSDVAGKVLPQGSAGQRSLKQADRARQAASAAQQRDAVDRYRDAANQGH